MQLKDNKILFATTGLDGHFNPLTGLAKFLQAEGCDVRWYTSACCLFASFPITLKRVIFKRITLFLYVQY